MNAQWHAVRDRIREELETLGLPEALIVREPSVRGPAPREAWWQVWRSRRAEELPTIYVQFMQFWADDLICEFTGSTLIGGQYPMSEQFHERLRHLGWLIPGDPEYVQSTGQSKGAGNYAMRPHPVRIPEIAQIAAESLALFISDPRVLQYERVS